MIIYSTAGSVLGSGLQTFISDWDKVTAAVSLNKLIYKLTHRIM